MMAREYSEMPVDFMECWVTSLWALDAIEALMPNNRANRDFLPYVSKLRVLMLNLLGLTAAELTGPTAADIRAGLDRSDRKSTRLHPSHSCATRMPSPA